jgi:fructose-1,6-bisphosphatase/inositol monophosphatase family enzyme
MNNDQSGKRSLKVSTGGKQERLRWSCHPPLDAINADWHRSASALQESGDYVAPTPHADLMVTEGLIEVSLQLEGAPWDYAAFAAVVQAAGGQFSYLDASIALGGIRPALFTNGLAHDEAIAALT